MFILLGLTLFSFNLLAQGPGDFEFSSIETQELSEVVITACSKGKKPCYPNQARYGCVRSDLNEKAFKKACNIVEEEYKKYVIDCYVKSGANVLLLAKTTNQNACDELKEIWTQVWSSPDNLLLQKKFVDPDRRLSFFQNNLMAKRSNRDQSVTANQINTNKKGKIYGENNKTLRSRIMLNLEDYEETLSDFECGPGILPGVDKVPVLDQRSQGTCYAHATSSMIDYMRRFKMGRQQTYGSPLMAAIDYKLAETGDITTCQDPMASGRTCLGFNSQMKNGFCDAQEIENSIIKSFNPSGKTRKTSWYMSWSKSQIAFDSDGFRIEPNDHVLDYLYVIGSLYQEKKWEELKRLWTSLDLTGPLDDCRISESELLDHLKWNNIKNSQNLESFYVSFFNGICKREKAPFKASCRDYSVPASSKIDEWIGEGYPLGISYCSAVLSDRNFKAQGKSVTDDKRCGPHASLIVGTARDKKGRCSYVVRNSWGKGCSSYDKDYQCVDGNIFIPKEVLLKNTFSIQKISED